MILIGTKCQLEQTVTEELTAAAVGSGLLNVFGTPYMIGLMENAAQSAAETQPAFGDRGRDGDGAAVKNVNFDWGTGFHGAPPKLFTTW